MEPIKRILYPTDFSESADEVVPYVMQLARQLDASVVALHVVSPPIFPSSISGAPTAAASLEEMLWESAQEEMESLRRKFNKHGLEIESLVLKGTPFLEIISQARARQVDLILMATHGLGVIKHMLLGSTAERVLRKAPCPVMIVRKPDLESVRP